ncbi:MAG: PEGA domain-containing protein [Candidatus Saccharibacteria bacterium]
MHHHDSKQNKLIKIIAVYTLMTVSTIAIVTFIVLFVLGFRLDTDKGQLEQYAFLQFNSKPTGAMVAIDGNVVSGQTPNKSSVRGGNHEFVIWKDGYETWRKTLDVKSGTLTWLNYILMIPKKLDVESVATYPFVYASLASPAGKYMIVQKLSDTPDFDLVDLSSDTIKSTALSVSKKHYSEAYTSSFKHVFSVEKWDQGERYLLIKHNYNDKVEWLIADTQNIENTVNITKLFDLSFSNIEFSGNGGNILFTLESGNLRKLDIGAETISKTLVSKVKRFNIYDNNLITYVGYNDAGARLVGVYHDGDGSPYVIKNITSDDSVSLRAISTHYFNEDYIAIAEGRKIEVFSGDYRTVSNGASKLNLVKSIDADFDIQRLDFSPIGQYVLAQSGVNFISYDIEYQNLVTSTVDSDTGASPLRWLNKSYFWADSNGQLTIREFDGTNPRSINSVASGQSATITKNERYIYSINKIETGYQLQRVRLVLI